MSRGAHALSALKNSYVTPYYISEHHCPEKNTKMEPDAPAKSSTYPSYAASFTRNASENAHQGDDNHNHIDNEDHDDHHHDSKRHYQSGMLSSDRHARSATGISLHDSNKARMYANFADIRHQLDNVSDEDFYDKLQQLKEEHRQTLEFCEYLYNNKMKKDKELHKSMMNGDYFNPHIYDSENVAPPHRNEKHFSSDHVLDMSSKPPAGFSDRAVSSAFKHRYSRNIVSPARPSSAPSTRNLDYNRPLTTQQDYTHNLNDSSPDMSETEVEAKSTSVKRRNLYENSEYQSSMDKINSMWDSFSIDRYAPSSKLRQSFSSDSLNTRRSDSWRHRITVPEEFDMMKREANKPLTKSRSMIMHERNCDHNKEKEEIECQKKFKARPVPAHVYMPLYDEIREKNESRRQYIKEYSKQLLKSMERPFKFSKREEQKKRQRCNSAPLVEYDKPRNFKAKSVPNHILDEAVSQRLLEEAEYQKIRNKMRQNKLMSEASMPPRMEAHERVKKQTSAPATDDIRSSKKRSKSGSEFTPRINRQVPDYDELYRRFQKDIYLRKKDVRATVTEPFNLSRGDRSERCRRSDKIVGDTKRDDETRWPHTGSQTTPRRTPLGTVLTSSLDSLPHRSTETYHKRSSANRDKLNHMTRSDLDDFEVVHQRRMKDMKVRRGVQERTAALAEEYRPRKTIADKIRDHQPCAYLLDSESNDFEISNEDAEKLSQYRRTLREMNDRVSKRPFLFEQTHEDSAKRAAERKFRDTLNRHSIEEDAMSAGSGSPPHDTANKSYDSARFSPHSERD